MDSIHEHGGDFFDHDPSMAEKSQMRKERLPPSEWLKLLCRDWVVENLEIAQGADLKFLGYKSYLKGKLSSQLLCRLSIPEFRKDGKDDSMSFNFWRTLGLEDEFDIRHIISQIEKFCSLYSIRSTIAEDELLDDALDDSAAAAAAGLLSPLHNFLTTGLEMNKQASPGRREPRPLPLSNKAATIATHEKRAAEKLSRETTREEKRQKKLFLRHHREKIALEQKEAALKRAADLVSSNRIPIEITRGASLPKAVKQVIEQSNASASFTGSKRRSDIVVSNASDLDRIVTHAKNLWIKYNAIAKEHNQKISWAMISKELGIHVKVREKYARMHARAVQRGFDFKRRGDFKIKEHPEIFLEPIPRKRKSTQPATSGDDGIPAIQVNDILHEQVLAANQQLRHEVHPTHVDTQGIMDSSLHVSTISDESALNIPTVPDGIGQLHNHDHTISLPQINITDDQVAAAVDAAIKTVPVDHSTDFDAAAEEAAEVALAAGPSHLGDVDGTEV
mmetsp:Transcript_29945/g.45834  ORF Transcript_29945/g.45834 Transcript_29945/m.45834 type:complete len:505 (-) Transcript_29945:100-1614(-)